MANNCPTSGHTVDQATHKNAARAFGSAPGAWDRAVEEKFLPSRIPTPTEIAEAEKGLRRRSEASRRALGGSSGRDTAAAATAAFHAMSDDEASAAFADVFGED